MNTRNQLRKTVRGLRRNLSPEQQKKASHLLLSRIRQRLDFIRAKHIALYLPNDGEIDPQPLIALCWKLGKTVYLPVLHPTAHNRLWFVPYSPKSTMIQNIYGIQEPKLIPKLRRNAWALNLVFLPLVAFDAQGNRMGMGGGYYDRTFDFKAKKRGFKSPNLIGLAHEIQRVEKLPVENWDIPLESIISDRNSYPE